MPARVRSERTSLSNCANDASTPSISLPVEVSSIGSVAERKEMPSDFRCDQQREVVVLFAGETSQVEDNDEVNLSLVGPAGLQKPLELRCGSSVFGALAFFLESLENREALPFAVVLTCLELSGEAKILGLARIRYAHVDDGTNHVGQISPDLGAVARRSRGACRLRRWRFQGDFDEGVSQAGGVASKSVDVFVREAYGFTA